MRKIILSLAIFSTFFIFTISSFALENTFNDIDDSVFKGYIETLAKNDFISSGQNSYRPNSDITRFETAKIVKNASNITSNTTCTHEFTDVTTNNVFHSFVKTLVCNDVISKNTNFNGSSNITRAEFIKMTVEAFKIKAEIVNGPNYEDVGTENPFYGYIEFAKTNGLIKGANTFRPNSPISRGEVAKIISIAFENKGMEQSFNFDRVENEPVKLILKTTTEKAIIGNTVGLEAQFIDANGDISLVDRIVTFETDFGQISEKEVQSENGIALTTLTSFLGGEAILNASSPDFVFANMTNDQKTKIQFISDKNKRFNVRSAARIIAPKEKVLLFMTVLDNYGVPTAGHSHNISYLQDGKGILSEIQEIPAVEGGYFATYEAGNVAGHDTLSFRDDSSGETTSVFIDVGAPRVIVRTLQDNCSIFSECGALVQLRDSFGAPVTGALENDILDIVIGNSNYATLNKDSLIEIRDGESRSGIYYFEFETLNIAEPLDFTIRLNSGNTLNKFSQFELHDYKINLYAYNNHFNSFNGSAVVVMTVEDTNGNKVSLEAWNDLGFRIQTEVDVISPDMTTPDWTDENDFEDHAPAGVYVTEIIGNRSRNSGPVEIEVMHQDTIGANKEIATITLEATHPVISEVKYFKNSGAEMEYHPQDIAVKTANGIKTKAEILASINDPGATTNSGAAINAIVAASPSKQEVIEAINESLETSNLDFIMVRVEDADGFGIFGLEEADDDAFDADTCEDNQPGITGTDTCSEFYISTDEDKDGAILRIAKNNVYTLEGGLYLISATFEPDDTTPADPNDTTNKIIKRLVIVKSTNKGDSKNSTVFGIDHLVESVSGSADTRRSSYGFTQLNPTNYELSLYGEISDQITPDSISEKTSKNLSTNTKEVSMALPSFAPADIGNGANTGSIVFNGTRSYKSNYNLLNQNRSKSNRPSKQHLNRTCRRICNSLYAKPKNI